MKPHNINLDEFDNVFEWLFENEHEMHMAIYDRLKEGFTHHFIQPCYIDTDSVEQNGKNFQVVESLVKESNGWRLSLQTHKWMGVL